MRSKVLLVLGVLLLVGAVAALPFVFPSMLQRQTQYLAGLMVLIAALLAFWSAHLTRLATEKEHERIHQREVAKDAREHQRQIETSFRDRFTTIAGQLGSPSSATQQAAIYGLAALADDWKRHGAEVGDSLLGELESRICINLLATRLRFETGASDNLVRAAITDTLRKHLLSGRQEQPSWIGIELDLSGALLAQSNLSHANLVRANLTRANLSGANLMRSNLNYADLIDTDLRDAKLTGANLKQANLSGADLRGAELAGVIEDEATMWPDGHVRE